MKKVIFSIFAIISFLYIQLESKINLLINYDDADSVKIGIRSPKKRVLDNNCFKCSDSEGAEGFETAVVTKENFLKIEDLSGYEELFYFKGDKKYLFDSYLVNDQLKYFFLMDQKYKDKTEFNLDLTINKSWTGNYNFWLKTHFPYFSSEKDVYQTFPFLDNPYANDPTRMFLLLGNQMYSNSMFNKIGKFFSNHGDKLLFGILIGFMFAIAYPSIDKYFSTANKAIADLKNQVSDLDVENEKLYEDNKELYKENEELRNTAVRNFLGIGAQNNNLLDPNTMKKIREEVKEEVSDEFFKKYGYKINGFQALADENQRYRDTGFVIPNFNTPKDVWNFVGNDCALACDHKMELLDNALRNLSLHSHPDKSKQAPPMFFLMTIKFRDKIKDLVDQERKPTKN